MSIRDRSTIRSVSPMPRETIRPLSLEPFRVAVGMGVSHTKHSGDDFYAEERVVHGFSHKINSKDRQTTMPCMFSIQVACEPQKVDGNRWVIAPFFSDKKPCYIGYLRQEKLQQMTRGLGLQPIAFHRFGWADGEYHSSLSPIQPEKANHSITPANQWSTISYHLAKSRTDRTAEWDKPPHPDELARILDERKDDERLARSISYSLGGVWTFTLRGLRNFILNELLTCSLKARV